MLGRVIRTRAAALALLGLMAPGLAAGCSGGTEPEREGLAPFVGSWDASSFVLRALQPSTPLDRLDLIGLGVTLELTVNALGSFVMVQTVPGAEAPFRDEGRLTVDPDRGSVTLTFDSSPGDPLTGSFQFSDERRTLTLNLPEADFDFDGDGEGDPARSRIVFQKASPDS